MELKRPFGISSRLLPCLAVGGADVQLEYAGSTSDGRTRYRWRIDFLGGGAEFTGNDLKSGCGGGTLQAGFESLLSFLVACGESVAYGRRMGRVGENADLFPPRIAAWADRHSDELSGLLLEIEEAEEPLIVE